MSDLTFRATRSFKEKLRLLFTGFALSAMLTFIHACQSYAWLLGYHSNIGTPSFVLPQEGVLLAYTALAIFIAGVCICLYYRRYQMAGVAWFGAAIALIFSYGILYNPLHLINWIYSYWNIPQLTSVNESMLIISACYLGFCGIGFLVGIQQREIEVSGAHGTAELKYGDRYLNQDGFIVGRHFKTGELMHYSGEKHLVTTAPTREGKGVGSIIPTLITYQGSVILFDPKGENCDYTWERRKNDLEQNVFVIDPFYKTNYARAHGTDTVNLMDFVRYKAPEAYDYAKQIAANIITKKSRQANEDFWITSARRIYAGLIYYISQAPEFNDRNHPQYSPRLRCLPTITDLFQMPKEDLDSYLKRVQKTDRVDDETKTDINDLLNTSQAEKMYVSIVATLMVNIGYMSRGRMRDVMSAEGRERPPVDLNQVIDQKSTLYVVMPLHKAGDYTQWTNTVVSVILDLIQDNRSHYDEAIKKNRVLFALDEFANLGYLDSVKKGFTTVAGYGAVFWVFVQDIPQFESVYGRAWKTFKANAGVFQVFGISELDTAKYVSEEMGETTIIKRSKSQNDERSGLGISDSRGMSQTVSETGRRLRTPSELKNMPQDQQILLPDKGNPVLCKKVQYFKDPEFEGKFQTREQVKINMQDVEAKPGLLDQSYAIKRLKKIMHHAYKPKPISSKKGAGPAPKEIKKQPKQSKSKVIDIDFER